MNATDNATDKAAGMQNRTAGRGRRPGASRWVRGLAGTLLLVGAAATGAVEARLWPALAASMWDPQPAQPSSQNLVPETDLSLKQAADIARRHTGGRVLSAQPVEAGGETGYRVRVLLDGKKVRTLYVDPQGRVSSR